MRASFADRLAARVDRSGGPESCWRGTGIQIRSDGAFRRLHIAVWEAEHGSTPQGARLQRQCASAACVNPRHFKLRRRKHANDPFVAALNAAKTKRGMTIDQIGAFAGVAGGTIRMWLGQPEWGIWSEDLRSVATVLEAPELLDLRETKARRIAMTCIECGCERLVRPGDLRKEINKRRAVGKTHPADGRVDWIMGTGSFRCSSCSGRRNGLQIAKRWRAHGLERMRRRMRRIAAAQTPAQRQAAQEKRRATMRARGQTPEARASIARGQISPDPVGTFAICRYCGLIYCNPHAPRWRSVYGMHGRCFQRFQHENPHVPGRRWAPPPPRKRGKQLTPEEIARSWELAVRVLLRGATIGSHEGSLQTFCPMVIEGPRVPTCRGAGLALEHHLQPRTIERRIEQLIRRLPRDGRGDAQFQHRSSFLVVAWNERYPTRRL